MKIPPTKLCVSGIKTKCFYQDQGFRFLHKILYYQATSGRIVNVLVGLHGCAGWYLHMLFLHTVKPIFWTWGFLIKVAYIYFSFIIYTIIAPYNHAMCQLSNKYRITHKYLDTLTPYHTFPTCFYHFQYRLNCLKAAGLSGFVSLCWGFTA